MEQPVKQNKISEEERLKLAEKLDKDLDDFINSLEKKPYKEGWSEDNWLQEIEKHPFFMKKAPEDFEDVHPMLEGLQQLKFDPDENTSLELAEKYKEDGNHWMKHKKYRIAIINYTEGLQQKHDNDELTANLYNNRSAANFFLKNYRSAYKDGMCALRHKGDYHKVKVRVLKCNLELKKYDQVLEDAEKFIFDDPTNKELIDIQKEAIAKRTEKLRDERKNQMLEKKKRQEFQTLVQALIQRKVKFEGVKNGNLCNLLSVEAIRPKIEPLEHSQVSLDKHGIMYWPIVFCYPEFSITDIQQQVHEMKTLRECLEDMFTLDEDKPHNYKNPDDFSVYYENRLKGMVFKADTGKSIKDIVSSENFCVFNGYLTFYVVPKDSQVECEFVNQIRKSILSHFDQ